MIYKNIEISQINFDDKLFSLANPNSDIHWSQDSQVFNPIWLHEIALDEYRIVDGFNLLNAIWKFDRSIRVPALFFNRDDSLVEIWKKRVLKRLNEQNLPVLAFLEGLIKVLEYLDTETLPSELHTIAQSLGIKADILKHQPLKKNVHKIIQCCAFADLYSLNYKDITNLSSRKKEDLSGLSNLFGKLMLKGNKLNSILQMVDDLLKGYNLSIQNLLDNDELVSILKDTPRHQRYKQLKDFLSSLRWPTLTIMRKDWSATLKNLKIPKQVTVTIDPFFEADEIEFKFKTSSATDYKKLLDHLREKADTKEITHLFEFI